jgi:hypothetical protein
MLTEDPLLPFPILLPPPPPLTTTQSSVVSDTKPMNKRDTGQVMEIKSELVPFHVESSKLSKVPMKSKEKMTSKSVDKPKLFLKKRILPTSSSQIVKKEHTSAQSLTQSYDNNDTFIRLTNDDRSVCTQFYSGDINVNDIKIEPSITLNCKCNKPLLVFRQQLSLNAQPIQSNPCLIRTMNDMVLNNQNVYKITPRDWNTNVDLDRSFITHLPSDNILSAIRKCMTNDIIITGNNQRITLTNNNNNNNNQVLSRQGHVSMGWCKEDGVVYNLLWCRSCSRCVGVHIVATDGNNIDKMDERWIYQAVLEEQEQSSPNLFTQKYDIFVISDEEEF